MLGDVGTVWGGGSFKSLQIKEILLNNYPRILWRISANIKTVASLGINNLKAPNLNNCTKLGHNYVNVITKLSMRDKVHFYCL